MPQAIAGPALVDYLNSIDKVVKQLGAQFKTRAEDIPARVAALTDELKSIQKQLAEAQSQAALAKVRHARRQCSICSIYLWGLKELTGSQI